MGLEPSGLRSLAHPILFDGTSDARADADLSALHEIDACVSLLDRVWPQVTPPTDQLPERLGRFRILDELGRGGFGIVFLAEDPVLGRRLALKVPRIEVLSQGEAWRRFQLEARAASRLDHPNLVPLLETGHIGPIAYIASVYVEGPSLETWLARRQSPVPVRLAARLVGTLARAIDHVHQRGILHRDLKPANVLLHDGQPNEESGAGVLPFVPRICDFGLAKLLDTQGDESRTLAVAGSPPYMAPEQAEGRKSEIGPATDVYGLGAILYELLTGRPPFRGKTSLDTLRQVVAREPDSPRRLRSEIPRDLETICLACLAKSPQRRYRTAASLADDMERFLDTRAIQARPVAPWERAWKWGRRHNALASLALVMAFAAVAAPLGLRRHYSALESKNHELSQILALARQSEQKALVHQSQAAQLQRQDARRAGDYHLRQAQMAVEAENLELAGTLLDAAGPELGSVEARGFAWHYLRRQVQRRITVLDGHGASVEALAASPDGQTLASGDADGTVRLWNLATGSSRLLEPRHHGPVGHLSFSPGGRRLASTALVAPAETYLWELPGETFTGRVRHSGSGFSGIWFSADGMRLVALHHAPLHHPHRLLSWESSNPDSEPIVQDPAKLRDLELADPGIQSVADLLSGETPHADPTGVQEPVWSRGLAFTRDGRFAVFGPGDGTFQVLCTQAVAKIAIGGLAGQQARVLLFFRSGVADLDQHVDRLITSLGRIGGESGLVVRRAFGKELHQTSASCPGAQEFAQWGSGRQGPSLVDPVSDQERLEYMLGSPIHVSSMIYLPDGKTLAFGSRDCRIRLWRLNPLPDPPAPRGHGPAEAWSVAFSPGGRTLATSGDDHLIRLWNSPSGTAQAIFRGHGALVTAIACSPDGTTLASASMDKKLRLWDIDTGKPTLVLKGHTDRVRAVAYRPDGRLLASASDDHTVRLWNPVDGQELAQLQGHTERIHGLAFSPDGRTLASGALDGQILFWNLHTLRSQSFAIAPKISSLAFAPDGETLASSHFEGPTRLWDIATARPRVVLHGHNGDVFHLAFSPDGRTLATAGRDATVRLWDPLNGHEMLCLTGHKARVNGVAFSPDGRTLASVDHGGSIRIWRSAEPDDKR
jgi:WD40 repeat protein/tRNA A-37 threonylcarbamoyl transferase component Bud32